MAKTYRKTATIQAIQFDGTNLDEIKSFTNGLAYQEWLVGGEGLIKLALSVPPTEDIKMARCKFYIRTLEGPLEFTPGCWIASGGNDDYWAIQDDIFVKTYEEVQ